MTQGSGTFSGRLRLFVIASFAFHALVFAIWHAPQTLPGQSSQVLSVSLLEETDRPKRSEDRLDEDHQNQQTTPSSSESPSARFSISYHHTITARSVSPEQAVNARADATARTAVASGQGDTSNPARAQIRSRLKTDLARHFHYPYVARLRGWEGNVLLSFTVESNGRLNRIRVAQSSGFPVLDRSALDSLGQVGYIKEAVAWLNGHAVDMQVPVIYHLEDAR